MANRSRIQIAKPDIKTHFDGLGQAVFHQKDLAAIFRSQRAGWRLAQSMTLADFLSFLTKQGWLRTIRLELPHRPLTVYTWGEVPVLQALLRVKERAYFSHFTAMRWLGLTEQVPNTLYLSHERSTPSPNRSELDQQAIDEAFVNPPRVSQNVAQFGDWRVTLISSAQAGNEGVVQDVQSGYGEPTTVRFTNMERTLIDAVVRPIYSGGVGEVAKAFEMARDRFSANALAFMLRRLNFNYPYHQAIGFYMERAGYRARQLERFRKLPMPFDFYLTHGTQETRYVPEWKLHVPASF